MGQRPLSGIHHSSTTTPSSEDDIGNFTIANGNGTHHDTNGAAVSGKETHGEEFIGEWDDHMYFDL